MIMFFRVGIILSIIGLILYYLYTKYTDDFFNTIYDYLADVIGYSVLGASGIGLALLAIRYIIPSDFVLDMKVLSLMSVKKITMIIIGFSIATIGILFVTQALIEIVSKSLELITGNYSSDD